jgi:hypothetical protein
MNVIEYVTRGFRDHDTTTFGNEVKKVSLLADHVQEQDRAYEEIDQVHIGLID